MAKFPVAAFLLAGACVVASRAAESKLCGGGGEDEAEAPTCSGRAKTFWAHNNGENEGVQVTVEPTEDLASLAEELAERLDARAILEPHQAEYGFGETYTMHSGATGRRIESWIDILAGGRVYLVPKGFLFMWPTVEVGHTVEVDGIDNAEPGSKPVRLRTLSHSPRVFEIENLFSPEEGDAIRQAALDEADGGNRFQRSATGHTGNVDPFRTSDNAFVSHTNPTSLKVQRRAFSLLRMPYDNALADGIQVLRYNISGGYRWHTDWFPEKTVYGRNHDVTRGGVNRFATVFLFLSDVEFGGQTGFPEAEGDTSELNKALALAEKTMQPGSWEIEAVQKCFGRLSVKPAKAKAILFYSLKPNGRGDPMSMHTGCPVLEGEKWAANLWVWTGPWGLEHYRKPKEQIKAVLVNRMNEPTQVSWVTNPRSSQGVIQPGGELTMHTYDGDSFVFRDMTRTRVLSKWTADAKFGKTQRVDIRFQTQDLEARNPGSIRIELRSTFDAALDFFWANNMANALGSIAPHGNNVIYSYNGHTFKFFKAPDRVNPAFQFTVDSSKGQDQVIVVQP